MEDGPRFARLEESSKKCQEGIATLQHLQFNTQAKMTALQQSQFETKARMGAMDTTMKKMEEMLRVLG